MKNSVVYLSQRLEPLVDCLVEQLRNEACFALQNRILLVPNHSLKQWLLLEIARREGIAMGLKLWTPQELLQSFSPPNALEMLCLIQCALSECSDPGLLNYLQGKPKRLYDLAEQLSSLFFNYGQFEAKFFDPLFKPRDWQEEILQKIFVFGPARLPIQVVPSAQVLQVQSLHCFGIDGLPPFYWDYLFRFPNLFVYQFSPCQDFWADICSDAERRHLSRFLKKRKISEGIRQEFDAYLREAPSLLANWGKWGRETLKIFDQWDLQIEEHYAPPENSSLLHRVQNHLLSFSTSKEFAEADSSIQIALTGSSRLREVEVLRDQIIDLAHREGIAFHEMVVLASDLEPYIPLIEFVFNEPQTEIPYRISGVDIGKQSPFSQGLLRLIQFLLGRWEVGDLFSLFETPSFYRKQNWDERKTEKFREWIRRAHIEWGVDGAHRQRVLTHSLGEHFVDSERSWEKGFDLLLNGLIFYQGQGAALHGLEISADDLEELLGLMHSLKSDLALFQSEATLAEWANRLEQLGEKYLLFDASNEADGAAKGTFNRLLHDLRNAQYGLESRTFPFAAIQRFLQQPSMSQIHASHLHAVRIAPLEEEAMIPAKAVFLIGLDEDHFPRLDAPTSLDLINRKKMAEKDRYLFLQALFAAKDFFRISFGHLSPEEGKPVNPSLLVQELVSYLSLPITVVYPSLPFDARCFDPKEEKIRSYSKSDYETAQAFYGPKRALSLWPDLATCSAAPLPEGEITLSISELSAFARHPWKFYLQKVHGMYLNESWEESFALQKSQLLKASLFQPLPQAFASLPGLLGESLLLEVEEKAKEWKLQLEEWGVKNLTTLHFLENCSEQRVISPDRTEFPAVQVSWPHLTVRLVGEIKNATSLGFLHTGEDSVEGVLRIWPEALLAAIATGSSQILLLKTGEIRPFEVGNALKAFLEYYFRCLSSPSPLLPGWADAFLRKGQEELSKKMQSTATGRQLFEDPVIDWVLARTEMPSAENLFNSWGSYLKETFSSLASIYPTRAQKQDKHAAV
jgi:exodeoxyribonuclease V gamma subunit